ncbi:LOW QUALITY PROTEIN: low-density lipoprotein receptor-related protein 3 [Erpetoichthys calabaricus]|uniref:LOW QUALITY PROTEIN: low-density lipoprotein receptor-related protein 3 n=1 Tax=Erpetoichthys calabaricus TaxID=27687 RepID=UPI0022348DFA|nr:LOW QUALITY PROTEIN: low-density lipoprotein receptor-related protein 3 [Erpetoichthys calabaricus]
MVWCGCRPLTNASAETDLRLHQMDCQQAARKVVVQSGVPTAAGMAACKGKLEQHTERRGVIYSPSWPLNYPTGLNCSWYIQGDHGDVITISFRNFDLQESHQCTLDWLLIGPASKKEEFRICGSIVPPPFISSRDHVWIFFHSDASNTEQAQGFRLSYIRGKLGQSSCQIDEFLCGNGKCIPATWKCNVMDECGDNTDEKNCAPPPTESQTTMCPSETFQCKDTHSTQCLSNTLRCNSVKDCSDGSDEQNCPDTSCGKQLGNFYGSFASPDFFRSNHNVSNMLCLWFIDTQDQRHIILQLDLQLGFNDYVRVYDGLGEQREKLLQSLSYHNNKHSVSIESSKGQLTVMYHAKPKSVGHGFNATYQVKGYCFPWEHPCGSDEGCYADNQHCDGWWHCPNGKDEENCPACQADEYPCEGNSGMCYTYFDRCNNQKNCLEGSDEKNCFTCQPGNFHCGTNMCIFETWRCDGQEDCPDGSDEQNCLAVVPRKVITAALIGSLICGLLLVIALGCAFKLYSLRTREYRAFETQMTRLEAEFVRREAPPSYGQLIAQGLIPPVEDFPVYNSPQASVLQNIRTAMRRQIRRHTSRRASSRRHLGRLWSRLFHRGTRICGQIPLLTTPSSSHTSLSGGIHSYQAVSERQATPSATNTGQIIETGILQLDSVTFNGPYQSSDCSSHCYIESQEDLQVSLENHTVHVGQGPTVVCNDNDIQSHSINSPECEAELGCISLDSQVDTQRAKRNCDLNKRKFSKKEVQGLAADLRGVELRRSPSCIRTQGLEYSADEQESCFAKNQKHDDHLEIPVVNQTVFSSAVPIEATTLHCSSNQESSDDDDESLLDC